MYFHQSSQQSDKSEFIKAIFREFNVHYKKKHYTITPKEEAPKGDPVTESVLEMNHKRDINTRRAYK